MKIKTIFYTGRYAMFMIIVHLKITITHHQRMIHFTAIIQK
jgi:hypothetical protein